MILNSSIWQEVIAAAKTATANAPAWLRAVERVDDQHTCEASRHGKACKHRAARRLMQRYTERTASMPAPLPAPAPKASDWRNTAILIKRNGNALRLDGWDV